MNVRGAGWKALLGSAVLIALTLGSSFWMITAEQRRLYNEDLTRQLLTAARMLREALREGWPAADTSGVAGLVHTLRSDDAAVIIMAADGRVLVDTTDHPGIVDGLLEQPEVQQALLSGWGERTRYLSGDLHESRIVAVRAGDDESMLGVVWLARPTWTIRSAWNSLGKLAAAIGAIALVSTLALAVLLTSLRARLLRRLTQTARSLSAGDLSAKADIAGSDEYAALSAALNQTRKRLARQVETIDRQRLTLEALVDQLHEGVVVVQSNGRVALINPYAIRLLNLSSKGRADHKRMIGLPLERCIPQHDLQRMLRGEHSPSSAMAADRDALPSQSVAPGDARPDQELRLHIDTAAGEVHLLARASDVALPGEAPAAEQPSPGRMLVLTDITELTRIIRVKTDFVANASHELRTPLSAIRAAVETLLEMDPQEDAEAARRFLESVDRQSARLEAMVSDLLDLSHLESTAARFAARAMDIRKEIDELHTRFEQRLESKQIRWEVHLADGVSRTVTANPHLLRLVLDNLVDNAVKFTERGGQVSVACSGGPDWAAFEVVDDGCGIPEPELERVFERFYQIERARSGNERGTGLGLSIVRHAVAAMNGTVALTSTPREGTRVTVRIPQPKRS